MFGLCVALGVPIAFAFGISTLSYLALTTRVPLTIMTLGVCLFGVFIERLGLVISLIVVTMVTALASRESRPLEFTALALVLTAFSVGIFVYALRLPLPIWPAL